MKREFQLRRDALASQFLGESAAFPYSLPASSANTTSLSFGSPQIKLGSSPLEGADPRLIRLDATIQAFDDSISPSKINVSSIGLAAFSARADHSHELDANVSPSLSGTWDFTAGKIITEAIGPSSGQQHVIPAVSSDTIALLQAVQTLSNKTLSSPILSNPTFLDFGTSFSHSHSTASLGGSTISATLFNAAAQVTSLWDFNQGIRVEDSVSGSAYLNLSSPISSYVGGQFSAQGPLMSVLGKLYLGDAATGFMYLKPNTVATLPGTSLQSIEFVQGISGWSISNYGDAYFGNVDVRGTIRASVLSQSHIQATAGSVLIAKSAAKLLHDLSVPGSESAGSAMGMLGITYSGAIGSIVSVDVEDTVGISHASSQLFAEGDYIWIKEGNQNVYLQVRTGGITDHTTYWSYSCDVRSGGPAFFPAGAALVNMGQSGQGYLYMTADGSNAPYYSVRKWTTNPYAGGNVVELARMGNLNGIGGVAVNTYGFYAGDGVNSIRYDPVTSPNLEIRALNGGFSIDGNRVALEGLDFLLQMHAVAEGNSRYLQTGLILPGTSHKPVGVLKFSDSIGNLISNFGFETGSFTNWTNTFPIASVQSVYKVSGLYSAKLESTLGVGGSLTSTPRVAATAGAAYYASGYVYYPGSVGNGGSYSLQVEWWDAVSGGVLKGTTTVGTGPLITGGNGGWERYEINVTAPAGTTYANIKFVCTVISGSATDTFYLDSIVLTAETLSAVMQFGQDTVTNISLYGVGFTGLTIGANTASNAMLDVRGSGLFSDQLTVVKSSSIHALLRSTSSTGYTSLRLYNDQNLTGRALEIDYAGSAYASSLLTSGITGEAASLSTTGAYPLMIGTNNTARILIDSAGKVGVGRTPTTYLLEVAGSVWSSAQLISTQATGTSPLSVASTTVNTNLNADMLDGSHLADIVGVPQNIMAFFNGAVASIPSGWAEYTSARGRIIVGVPSGGTVAGTVGSALTNLQNVTHTHTISQTGWTGMEDGANHVATAALGGAAATPGTGSASAGSIGVPYIQQPVVYKT